MNTVKSRLLDQEDCYICRIFIVFMSTPLALLLMAGTTLAIQG